MNAPRIGAYVVLLSLVFQCVLWNLIWFIWLVNFCYRTWMEVKVLAWMWIMRVKGCSSWKVFYCLNSISHSTCRRLVPCQPTSTCIIYVKVLQGYYSCRYIGLEAFLLSSYSGMPNKRGFECAGLWSCVAMNSEDFFSSWLPSQHLELIVWRHSGHILEDLTTQQHCTAVRTSNYTFICSLNTANFLWIPTQSNKPTGPD